MGSHVLRALLAAQFRVRALVRPGSRALPPLEGWHACVGGPSASRRFDPSHGGLPLSGACGGVVLVLPGKQQEIRTTNVRGCAGILQAAYAARYGAGSGNIEFGDGGAGRCGSAGDRGGLGRGCCCLPLSWVKTPTRASGVGRAATGRAPLAVTARPLGRETGSLRRRERCWWTSCVGVSLPRWVGMNVVAVEDVARAHVLALQYGRPRERYLVGGENLSLSEIWALLARICGRKAPTRRIPYGLALSLGWADDLRCRLLRGGMGGLDAPLVPLEGVRMARHTMYISDARARTVLGYEASSIQAALERAVRWYSDNGGRRRRPCRPARLESRGTFWPVACAGSRRRDQTSVRRLQFGDGHRHRRTARTGRGHARRAAACRACAAPESSKIHAVLLGAAVPNDALLPGMPHELSLDASLMPGHHDQPERRRVALVSDSCASRRADGAWLDGNH